MRSVLFSLCLFLAFHQGNAQLFGPDTTEQFVYFDLSYAYQTPGGDLAKRFGNSSRVGIAFGKKTTQNWTWQLDWFFTFSDNVVERDILAPFVSEQGFIIGTTGLPADVFLFQRGYSVYATSGKVLNVLSANKNSGIWLKGSLGYQQHHIRIEDRIKEVPLINDEYAKGYDRLSAGFSVMEFVGYRYTDRNNRVNLFGGVELTQSFTQDVRKYAYDLQGPVQPQSRNDLSVGLRLGFSLNIKSKVPDEFYYD